MVHPGRTEPGRGSSRPHAVDQVALLLRLATRVTASLDLQEVLDTGLAALRELVEFGGGAIQLIEEGHLVAAATDPPMAPEARTVRIPVGQGVSGRIAQTGEPIYIPDITVDERVHPAGRKKGVSSGVRSYFGVPLILGGAPIGVIQVDAPQVDAFDEATRAVVLAFVPTIAAAVQNAQLFDQERESLLRLEELQRLKDGFVSIVSHELRTPLATALGFSETLAEHAGDLAVDDVRDFAQRIQSANHRLQRLLDDLMFVAGLEERFLTVDLRTTDVVAIVESVVRDDPPRDVAVALTVPDHPVWAMADPERLHQVVTNLVDNAAKFSTSADQHVWVTVEEGEDSTTVRVEDEGAGIPAELRDDIFGLFVQGEPFSTRTVGGLGIGLYVVKRLCDAMDVEVVVDDRPGGGSRFSVVLSRSESTDVA